MDYKRINIAVRLAVLMDRLDKNSDSWKELAADLDRLKAEMLPDEYNDYLRRIA